MRIAVDTLTLANESRNTGIHLYTYRLLEQMRVIAPTHRSLEIVAFHPERTANRISELLPNEAFRHFHTPLLDNQRKWRLRGMLAAARAVKPDVLFIPTAQVLPLTKIPIVTTIHDASAVMVRSQVSSRISASLRAYMWLAAKYSDQLLTVSHWSKNDIVHLYGIPESKVTVTYVGINREYFNRDPVSPSIQEELRRRYGLTRAYLYHHGTIQPRKNLASLIRAHRLMLERHRDLQLDLVLAGAKGWLFEPTIEEAKRTTSDRGRVIITGPLPEEELAALLKDAELAVIPSLYEGFCSPMVEAMGSGVPTVVSNTSCFPEVSGGVLKYFDPNSVEDMAETVYDVLCDSTERRRLAEAGFKFARRYDWTRCAIQTVGILAEACGLSKLQFSMAQQDTVRTASE